MLNAKGVVDASLGLLRKHHPDGAGSIPPTQKAAPWKRRPFLPEARQGRARQGEARPDVHKKDNQHHVKINTDRNVTNINSYADETSSSTSPTTNTSNHYILDTIRTPPFGATGSHD